MTRMLTNVLLTMMPIVEGAERPQPTKEGVLALAAKHTLLAEPELKEEDRRAIDGVKKDIEGGNQAESFRKMALNQAINELTLMLANVRSLPGLVVATAYLVTEYPKNLRALNLFGSVLHSKDEERDAIAVFEYALTLKRDPTILRLNLATCYLDANEDQKAYALLDRLRIDDPENKAVWKALAAYHFKKGDMERFRECLLKAAKFKGFKRKKEEKKRKKVEDNEVKPEDSATVGEGKLKQLDQVEPMTTADLLEDDLPDMAQLVHEFCVILHENERIVLPKLPQADFSNAHMFKVNKAIAKAWAEEGTDNLRRFQAQMLKARGIDPGASKKVKQQQGREAAMRQMGDSMQMAQQAMQFLQGMSQSGMDMPGMTPDKMARLQQKMDRVAAKQGMVLEERPVDFSAMPGVDSGSIFAEANHYNFQVTYNSYVKYFNKYWQEYNQRVQDIMRNYEAAVRGEDQNWEVMSKDMNEAHDRALRNGIEGTPHDGEDQPCRQALIDHKVRLNGISDQFYNQWESLYFTDYPQRMKPTLEAFYCSCMRYVRNMVDPKLMQQEHDKVIGTFTAFAGQAMGSLGRGSEFDYYPEVEEEQRQLDMDVARAREEAEARRPKFRSELILPEKGFTDWVDEHFVIDGSLGFFSLKVTTKMVEFRAAVPGWFSGAKYDFTKDKLSTYTGIGMKLPIGVNIAGMGGKLELGAEAYRRTATWDFKNGTYEETDTAKGEANLKLGPMSAGGEVEVDSQLHVKVKAKSGMNLFDGMKVGAQHEERLW